MTLNVNFHPKKNPHPTIGYGLRKYGPVLNIDFHLIYRQYEVWYVLHHGTSLHRYPAQPMCHSVHTEMGFIPMDFR